MHKILRIVFSAAFALSALVVSSSAFAADVLFVGSENNDLYRLLSDNGVEIVRFDTVSDAVGNTDGKTPIIITAPGYPVERASITSTDFVALSGKGARIFVEYPSSLPFCEVPDGVYEGVLERGVVTSRFFGKILPPMSILGINDAHLIPLETDSPIISFAKVAGFDTAQFGLKDTKAWPLLFSKGNIMVATTSLSGFTTGRFGPIGSFKTVWEGIIGWLLRDKGFSIHNMPVDPRPAFSSGVLLPADARKQAVENGVQWLWNARLFIHPSWEKTIATYQPEGGDPNLYFGPPIEESMLIGDGSRGIMEGHGSHIYWDGTQMYRYFVRGDIQGESAYMLAAAARLNNKPQYDKTAEKLLDYLFYTSGFRGDGRDDKNNPAYGLISWSNTHLGTFFNDDNARCILGAIGASALMDNYRWNSFIVENILANLRTSSRQGFQGNALEQNDIERNGWQYYNSRDFTNTHPHFESWMWACYLWLYDKTGYEPLLAKAKSGISIMMEAYPDRWKSQNGIQQERARMILPLAWLVRVEDTPEHRRWLDMIVSKLLESQDACGAIREELGNSASDANKILVTSNEAYGKNEAPLIARNGDPVADMLYTCNFSFFALNEAARATGDVKYNEAVKKLADFLVRIQVKSSRHKDIDGAWFRAFDYGRWDYWASNADNGWGAWCTLTGWIQSWIVATQTNVENGDSFWETTRKMDMTKALNDALWMFE
jgi:hypothetical protein